MHTIPAIKTTSSTEAETTAPPAPRKPRLLLIDGLNVVRRIFEAIPLADGDTPETESPEHAKERASGAMDSSWASFMRAIREVDPTHFLAPFDFGGKTWRHDLYPQYKAQRSPSPAALNDALPGFFERLNNFGLKTMRVPGVEADDVIGTVALKAKARGFEVVVLSTDKDMLWLLHHGIRVRDHFKSEDRDEAYVQAKFGVPPGAMVDMLSLMGDDTDGIPGIKGIGVQTAAKLIHAYGGLNGALDAVHDELMMSGDATATKTTKGVKNILKGAVGAKLRAHEAEARLSFLLASLKTDVRLEISPRDIRLPAVISELLERAKGDPKTEKKLSWNAQIYAAEVSRKAAAEKSNAPAELAGKVFPGREGGIGGVDAAVMGASTAAVAQRRFRMRM